MRANSKNSPHSSDTGRYSRHQNPPRKVRWHVEAGKSAMEHTIFIPCLFAVSPSFCDLLLQGFPVLIRLNEQTGQLTAFTSAFANFGTLRSAQHTGSERLARITRTLIFILGASGSPLAPVVNAFFSSRS